MVIGIECFKVDRGNVINLCLPELRPRPLLMSCSSELLVQQQQQQQFDIQCSRLLSNYCY